jgi:RNA polymerase sigma-70 factor, ECF subfamily
MPTIAPIATHELIELLRQKSRQGFNQLYDSYAPALYGIISNIIKDTAAAEDVLQEAFVKVWKNIAQYQEEKGTLFTWLLNITRYTAIDFLRSKQHKQQLKNQSLIDSEYIERQANVQPNVENSGLRGLVAKLEPKYREIIDLVYFLGHTQDEVSKILNMPLGTVKTRARMGLQILRNQL